MKRRIIIGIIVVVGLVFYLQRVAIEEFFSDFTKPSLPQPLTYVEVASQAKQPIIDPKAPPAEPEDSLEPSTTAAPFEKEEPPAPAPSPSSINLAVPFQPQAPFAEWVEPYKEACEEASIIMVDHYYRNAPLTAQIMKDEIDEQVAWQHEHFGGHLDLSIARVAELAEAFYPYAFRIISPLTVEKIRAELLLGHPVIVPAAGRLLGNPYFTPPGPYYHMFVIKGLTEDGSFITSEPGTRRGKDYVYSFDILDTAIHDWDGDSPDGPPVGLVLYPAEN